MQTLSLRYLSRCIHRQILFLGLLIVSSFAQAQEFWQGSSFGMTREAVQQAIPGTRQIEVSKQSGLHGGARELLRLDNLEIVNESFKVIFYFKEEKLVQVMLLPVVEPVTWHSAMLLFQSLTIPLRSKYGTGSPTNDASTNVKSTTWMSGRTNITLTAMNIGSPYLSLIYQVRVSADADKL